MNRVIELPPHMDNRDMPMEIQVVAPFESVFARSLDLEEELSEQHLENIQKLPGFSGPPQDSKDAIVNALANPDIEIAYFYCHGKRKQIDTEEPLPSLGVGKKKEEITPDEVLGWYIYDWNPRTDHWRTTSPLIFINGCHTAELTPGSLVSFVDAFVSVNAGGIIGTEITLHQRVANEAAEVFFANFIGEKLAVGEALRRMRLHLLSKGNLLGLVYTAYCSAELKLSQ